MAIKEVGLADIPIPQGAAGNLNDEQAQALREMWTAFFQCCDSATGSSTANAGAEFKGMSQGDPTKAGIPQDDAAKEEVKRQLEERELKALLDTYGGDALRDTFWKFVKSEQPDQIMTRFLRARKWDVKRALAMMATCLKWRLDSGVESIVEKGDLTNGAEIPKFLDQQQSKKIYAFGASKEEHPVCYVHMKHHFTFGQPAATMQQFVISQMEVWRLLFVPPSDKMVILFDLRGFGIRNMDWISLLYVVKCLEAYYAESLSKMYIHSAPWIFFGAWKIVRGLLDPVVRSKVEFTKGSEDLLVSIPKDRLLKVEGGDVDQTFDWVAPVEGENDRLKDTKTREKIWANHQRLYKEFEDTTRNWCSLDGKDEKVNEQRKILEKKLRLSQFDVEQFGRGLTAHHRNGNICMDNQGMVRWDYNLENSSDNIRQVYGHKQSRKSLERELAEISQGSSVKDAEAKTDRLLESKEWGDWWTCDDLALETRKSARQAIGSPIEVGNAPAIAAVALSNPNAFPKSTPKPQAVATNNAEAPGSQARQQGEAVAAAGAAGAAGVGGAAVVNKVQEPPAAMDPEIREQASQAKAAPALETQQQTEVPVVTAPTTPADYPIQKQNGYVSNGYANGNGTAATNGDLNGSAHQKQATNGSNATRGSVRRLSNGPVNGKATSYKDVKAENDRDGAPLPEKRRSFFGSIKKKMMN